MIFDFLMDKKRNLKEKLIEQKLALVNFGDIDKAKFDLMSEEKKQELIGKIEKDDAYMKDINGMVNEKFNNLKIREVSGNLKKVQYEKSINAENIMNADVSVKAENVLKEVREEKKKVLGDIDL